MEEERDFLTVIEEFLRDWNDDELSGRDPERPFTSEMLNQDG